MISTVVGVAVVVVLGVSLLSAGAATLFLYLRKTIIAESTPRGALEDRVTTLELQVAGLPSLWEDERKRAKRYNDAAKQARKAADEKLEEIEEIVASNGELPGEHAPAGAQLEMQPVRTNMGVAPASDLAERAAAVEWLVRR